MGQVGPSTRTYVAQGVPIPVYVVGTVTSPPRSMRVAMARAKETSVDDVRAQNELRYTELTPQ